MSIEDANKDIEEFIRLTNIENYLNDSDIIEKNALIHINNKLSNIHSTLKIKYGHFGEELPEQKMAVRYLTGKETVLEIGGNIGRNSLIIASLLDDPTHLVTLESNKQIVQQLIENKNLNHLPFHIENSALSNKPLIQKGWDTVQSNVLLDGYE